MKALVACPNCTNLQGIPLPLGEIGTDGDFVILRRTDTTIIKGKEFSVVCGRCMEEVYIKRERRNLESVDNGGTGVFGIGINQTSFPNGLGSIGSQTGGTLQA